MPHAYVPSFEVPYGKYKGQEELFGQMCDVWAFQFSAKNFSEQLVLWNVGNTPVALNVTMQIDGSFGFAMSFIYQNFRPANYSMDAELFVPPDDCLTDGPVCK
jgi:hypothetical protein